MLCVLTLILEQNHDVRLLLRVMLENSFRGFAPGMTISVTGLLRELVT